MLSCHVILKYIAQITLVEHNPIATPTRTHKSWFKDLHIQFNDVQSIAESVRKLGKHDPGDILILKEILKKDWKLCLKPSLLFLYFEPISALQIYRYLSQQTQGLWSLPLQHNDPMLRGDD